MRATLIVFFLSVSVALGQDVSRVFHLHHIDKDQDLNEFATMIRAVADVPKMSVDAAQKTLSMSGTAVQIAVAEWMYTELDRQTLPEFATKEFKVPNKEDDVVRVFFLHNTKTIQDFQEVTTTVRTITEMRRVFTFNTARALAVRGTVDQIAATEWMVRELDQPADAKRTGPREYQMTDTTLRPEPAVRILYLPYTSTIQQFQEVATMVRTIGEIRRVFTYNTPRALIVRGTPDQVALAAWFATELGKPVTAGTASTPYHYPVPDRSGENLVRVFYVKDVPTVAAFQQLATQIRTTAQTRRLFTYNETKAVAVRGTEAQLALVDQMLKDRALQLASNQ